MSRDVLIKDTTDFAVGHRHRMKKRLMRSSLGSLDDYEIVELMLFNSIPRKDVKRIAKILLKKFGNIGKMSSAPANQLSEIHNIGDSTIALFRLIQEVVLRVNKEQIITKPIFKSWDKLINYVRSNIGYSATENFQILYLNNKNIPIAEELCEYGTINSVNIYPREVVKRALYHEASGIVIVHNHPSGITEPSTADKEITKSLQRALEVISVKVLDHIIISSNSYFSFRNNDLL